MVITWKNFARLVFAAALLAATSGGAAFANNAAQQSYNQLPPCTMDSFVYQSGLNDAIYGDEGVDGPPPMMGFSQGSRIAAGFYGQTNAGLTTGHGSFLPDAWGADEFVGNEWDMTGSSSNTGNYPAPVYAPTGTFGAQVYGGAGSAAGSNLITVPVNGQLSLSSIPSALPAAATSTAATATAAVTSAPASIGAAVGNLLGSALGRSGF